MRVRAQDVNGDMTFGLGAANFLVDAPAAVAQLVLTGLLLKRGEWFIDTRLGTPYMQSILQKNTKATADATIRAQVLATQGVLSIDSYSSAIVDRDLSVALRLTTVYGVVTLEVVL